MTAYKFLTEPDEIRNWMKKIQCCDPANCTIHDDGVVDVSGNVHFNYVDEMDHLPVQFGRVSTSFNCYMLGLKTLEGAPAEVGANFRCGDNKITSLIGGPKKVGGQYRIGSNLHLTSFDGIAEEIGSGLYLDYLPDSIGLLRLLSIDLLDYIELRGAPAATHVIIGNYLAGKDIFGCQQALIEAGYERYAQL